MNEKTPKIKPSSTSSSFVKRISLYSVSLLMSSVVLPIFSVKVNADELPAGEELSTASEPTTHSQSEVELQNSSETQQTKADAHALQIDTLKLPESVPSGTDQFDVEVQLSLTATAKAVFPLTASDNLRFLNTEAAVDLETDTHDVIGHVSVSEDGKQLEIHVTNDYQGTASFKLAAALNDVTQAVQTVSLTSNEQTISQTITVSGTETTDTDTVSTESETTETSSDKETETTVEELEATETSTSSEAVLETSESTETAQTGTSEESSQETTESVDTTTSETTEPASSSSEKAKETSETKTSESAETKSKAAAPTLRTFSAPVLRSAPLTIQSPAHFVSVAASHAQQVAARNGLYASVMIAQACLESGYGTSTLSSAPNYNLFGIKGSYNGQSVRMKTWEVINGKNVYINADFRKYPSYSESFQDNANLLKTTSFSPGNYFYSGAWKANTNSYRDATAWLTGRYATDPNYGTKLNNIIQQFNLTQYDTPSTGVVTPPTDNSGSLIGTGTGSTTNVDKNTSSYTVKRGDTLSGIASRYGVTVANLKSWNGLKSDLIFVGQTLTIKGGNNNTGSTGSTSSGNSGSTASGSYKVKSGDTLYGIASRYGVTVANLKSWNGLKSDLIFVGQTLAIKGGNNNTGSTGSTSSGNSGSTASGSYKVKSGDTLSGIASRYGVTVANLKSWNGLKSDLIFVGQTLTIKGGSSSSSTSNTSSANTGNTSGNYKVKSGDTLYGIASKYGVTVANLKSWNGLKSDLIYVGQSLSIKGRSVVTVSNTSSGNSGSTASGSYKVKSGDTLSGIASRYGVTVANLKSWNGLKSDLIYVGQSLSIKGKSVVTVSNTSSGSNTSAASYAVKSGDTLYGIAAKYGVTVANLKSWNGLKSDLIYVGQKLSVKRSGNNSNTVVASRSHKVSSGDTLWGLAKKYGTTTQKIKTLNGLSSDTIYMGQSLKV
ncbi:LysM peptidoglycan-binding domain-containing protein [Vagococcus acidifermentans]|uniref:Peptidoglycan hydrolase n=1 Tax=Vagococcus acidifermentans TaxID=564710 RepID=A0A430AUV5_9ENTE|nr:LysM peptidoglycan-binding domain-containing protein [Vagococcus acidifermentans]RSU11831.1 hypothetical protein CBF27_07685 [Vagococcus acidifermentans]